jgi:hypothetical protein
VLQGLPYEALRELQHPKSGHAVGVNWGRKAAAQAGHAHEMASFYGNPLRVCCIDLMVAISSIQVQVQNIWALVNHPMLDHVSVRLTTARKQQWCLHASRRMQYSLHFLFAIPS